MKATSPLYRTGGFFVLRTPLFPVDAFERVFPQVDLRGESGCQPSEDAVDANAEISRSESLRLARDPVVAEALFVASPQLHEALGGSTGARGKAERKLDLALARYIARMSSRATPFGLFAGCSVGEVAVRTELRLAPRADYRVHARLDTQVLAAQLEQIVAEPTTRQALRFITTPSLHLSAGRAHFAQIPLLGTRVHPLVEVEVDDILLALLEQAASPQTPGDLARSLRALSPDASAEEIARYVDDLITEELLVPALFPRVTGDEPSAEFLAQMPEGEPRRRSCEAVEHLSLASRVPIGTALSHYMAAHRCIDALELALPVPGHFQVDLVPALQAARLGSPVTVELCRAALLLDRNSEAYEPSELARFRERFEERYGEAEVSLVEVLDAEAGIGLDDAATTAHVGVVDGLPFPSGPEPRRCWSARDEWLAARLHAALRRGSDEIEILDTDAGFGTKTEWPDGFVATATLLGQSPAAIDAGDFTLFRPVITSPSGLGLFARFCHADPVLERKLRSQIESEDARDREKILADVVHLSLGRVANVMLRPSLRSHEIVCHARSGASSERQIPAADLLIALERGRFVLRSGRLGRQVVPRQMDMYWADEDTTAPMYRFLWLLQREEARLSSEWSWGALRRSDYLPRVRAGRTVLAPAMWNLSPLQLARLRSRSGAHLLRELELIRRELRMPARVSVVEGDNILPLDLRNILCAEIFAQLARASSGLLIHESPLELGRPGVEGSDGQYLNEIAVPFLRAEQAPASAEDLRRVAPRRMASPQPTRVAGGRRKITPGHEVSSIKLFAGPSSFDALLSEAILPALRDPRALGIVERWHFVRYREQFDQLRVRFFGDARRLWSDFLPVLDDHLAGFVSSDRVWKLEFDTYQRELERYGGPEGMHLAEQIFHADSVACLDLLGLLEREALEQERWLLVALGWDSLLSDFGLDDEARRAFARKSASELSREFPSDAAFEASVAKRVRDLVASAQPLWTPAAARPVPTWLGEARRILAVRSLEVVRIRKQLDDVIGDQRLSVQRDRYMWSVLHMHANRLLAAEARKQEYVVYEVLERLYRGRIARNERVRSLEHESPT
jgi:thiopeptide-type bacteriocin biosynthesis protein